MRKPYDLRCIIEPAYVMQPRNHSFSLAPGTWCVFNAKVVKVFEGIPQYNTGDFIRVVGVVPSLDKGKQYSLTASSVTNKYGQQYRLLYMNEMRSFDSKEEQQEFLSAILTESQVKNLYKELDNPFDALQTHDMESLCKVHGIGPSVADKLIRKFDACMDDGPSFLMLLKYGLTKRMIDRLSDQYGGVTTAYEKIKDNPYILIDDVSGIGWAKADAIALESGLGKFSHQRVSAFIKYYLSKRAESGDSWVELSDIVDSSKHEIGITDDKKSVFKEAINNLLDEGTIWVSNNKRYVALSHVRDLEKNIALELKRIYSAPVLKTWKNIDASIGKAEKELGIQYTEEQRQAIYKVINSNVSILTGAGGTGKTTVVSGILKVLEGQTFAQTALSGRAAARMSEITGQDGYTIHRLLGYRPENGFEYNKNNPLVQQIIILDETSMVGADLFYHLVQAIATGSRLIMIGDDGQLESIGMCNVFKDMLSSNTIPVARLTKIHRQAAKSAIITESIKVRNAMQLTTYNWVGTEIRGELHDLEMDIYRSGNESFDHIMQHFNTLYETAGRDCSDIQIVLPQRIRGNISALRVNTAVQEIVNPSNGQDEIKISYVLNGRNTEYTLRVGDLVITTKNNYNTQTVDNVNCPIYNGNRGRIVSIDTKKGNGVMIVDFEQWGKIVIDKFSTSSDEGSINQWNNIELAYALTCHKLQGSEAKYVIIGMDNSARIMLTREWLYTAITRAKKYCVICAETDALNYSIKNSHVPFKQTFLQEFLKKLFSENTCISA